MKLLILGYKRSGKDFFAEILRDELGFSFKSSSEMANKIFIFDLLKEEKGYKTLQECFEDRVNHRTKWFDLICDYNKKDKLKLAKQILAKNDMYVGMRDYDEVEKSTEIVDLKIWIDAEERVGKEDTSSCTAKKEQADIVLFNNGTKEEFIEKVIRLGKLLKK